MGCGVRAATGEQCHSQNYFGPLTAIGVTPTNEIQAAVDDRVWQGFRAPAALPA